jgi:hypothetical protein
MTEGIDITAKDVEEFQSIYKQKFGKNIDSIMARKKLTLLVRQMQIVYKPIKKEQLEELARKEAVKEDAQAMAELIYDIYKKGKNESS